MFHMPFVADRKDVVDATLLIAEHGTRAGMEAAERADRSRDLGNHLHFCRWRQIERLVVLLSADHPVGLIH